ncbi:MAG: TonB-dependent receptor [Silvibacterium sp.]
MTKKSVVSVAVLGSVLLALAVLTHSAWSQDVTATIVGTITDPSGAAVPGASVKATAVDRGVSYNAVTNDAGLYRISELPVGNYTLTVEKTGFSTVSHESFVLTLNQIARIDIALKIGQVSETLQVTGSAPVLKTDATQVDTVINAATNDNLPLASRNYVQLTLLAPGAVSTDPSSFNNGNNTAGYGGRPLINGNREQANNFLLDGMDNNQVSDNLLGYTPSPDAIEEFNLITNNAPAEFGNFEGGIVNATIKSGTNKFHGDVWNYFRNDVLNANSWSNNETGQPKAALRWNMFGFTVGGPILKDRLFFFADYQGQRFDTPTSTSSVTVFTADERNGNFGAVCSAGFDSAGNCQGTGQLYNPCASFTAPCTPGSTPASPRSPFPYNQIPAAMISPVASALFSSSLYLTPTNSALQNNAVNTSNSSEDVDQGDLKIDYKLSSKDNISYRFTRAYQNNPSSNSFVLLSDAYATTPIINTVGNWTRTLTSNLLNNARFGWSHITLNSGNDWASNVGQFGNTIGIGNGNPANLPGLLSLGFSNTTVGGIGSSEDTQSFDDHVWQADDGLTWSHGRHSFNFGGQYQREILLTFYAGNNGELGLMGFNGQFTAVNPSSAGGGTGDGGADFVLGLPQTYGRGVSTGATWQQSSNIVSFYGEDTWRATDQLTLNLGVRYEAHTPWNEDNNQQANYNINTQQIQLAGQNGASGALYNGFYGGRDFQPRIGFAYTPSRLNGRTVIRGAFTISSYLEGTGTNLRLPLNPPFTPAEINAVYNNTNLPLTDTTDGIVGTGSNASCAAPAYACYNQALLRIWDPNVQPAIADEYSLTIQHQLQRDLTLQVGYVGQKGDHLMVPYDFGQRVLGANGSTANSPFFSQNLALYSALGNPALTDANGNLLSTDNNGVNEGATISGTKSNGNMQYNSLQAVLQKQMNKGLQGQVSYTYSKCMSDSTGYYGAWNNALSASAYWQNIYDQHSEWAPCYYDATHVLSAYSVYELPIGRGKLLAGNSRKAVDEVIGGWAVSPIVSFRTGWPIPIGGASDNSGTFSRGARADCNSLPSIQNTALPGIGRQWFTNNGNFTQPATGTFGNCSPQLAGLRTPRYTDVDASLHKDFPLTERFRLQFRSDFINLFNHPQFNAPNNGIGSTMGQITSAQPPRNIQLALKLYY